MFSNTIIFDIYSGTTMFNFFKKKKGITRKDYVFLQKIVEKLPDTYSYLKGQVDPEFILGKKENEISGKGTYTLLLNASLAKKYASKALPELFIIEDIFVWNIEKKAYSVVELDVLNGMLAGFKLEDAYASLNLDEVDTSKIKEKNFNNDDAAFVKKILGDTEGKEFDQFDINSSFKIDEPEGDFYTIKDFQDGNYLSIDTEGAVYLMLHDPLLLEKIFATKEDFITAVKSGKFDVLAFYEERMNRV